MPEQPKLRLTSPEAILDALPMLLGYSPVDSLIAIPLSGKRGGVLLRFELPSNNADPDNYAGQAIGQLASLEGVESAALIFSGPSKLDEHARRDGEQVPFEHVARAIDELADAAGIEIHLSLWRTPDFWGYTCPDDCCSSEGPQSTANRAPWPETESITQRLAPPAAALGDIAQYRFELWKLEGILDNEDHPDFLQAHRLLRDVSLEETSPENLARLTIRLRSDESTAALLTRIAFDETIAKSLDATVLNPEMQLLIAPYFDKATITQAEQTLRLLLGHLEHVDTDRESTLIALTWLAWSRRQMSVAREYLRQIHIDTPFVQRLHHQVAHNVAARWLEPLTAWHNPADTERPTTEPNHD